MHNSMQENVDLLKDAEGKKVYILFRESLVATAPQHDKDLMGLCCTSSSISFSLEVVQSHASGSRMTPYLLHSRCAFQNLRSYVAQTGDRTTMTFYSFRGQ